MFNLLGRVSDNDWRLLFEIPSARITLGSEEITLSAISRANFDNGKETLRKVAQNRIDATSASVVVMGHTHQPDEKRLEGGTYYNPGSWTRYLELTPNHKITLEDLKDESKYPYQLNVVRIEKSDDESLKSEMICFEHS